MAKIAILGGAFNPIHMAHLRLGEAALSQLGLDHVIFMPSYKTPIKDTSNEISPMDRLNMVSLAVKSYDNFSVSDYEIKKQGMSYTYETLKFFKEQNPDNEYFFIVGEDAFKTMHKWIEPSTIFNCASIICATRKNESNDLYSNNSDTISVFSAKKHLEESYNAKIYLLDFELIDISSSEIRNKIKSQQDIGDIIPPNVKEYIKRNHLYA